MNSTTRLVSLSSLLFALLFSSTALAGDQLRNLGEKAKDRQDIRQDNRQLKDNAVSVDRLDNLIDKWNDARLRNPNSPEVSRLGQELAEVMQHDLAISARQVANANKEVREANREVRSDRRKKKRSDRQELSDAANRGDEQAKRRAERGGEFADAEVRRVRDELAEGGVRETDTPHQERPLTHTVDEPLDSSDPHDRLELESIRQVR